MYTDFHYICYAGFCYMSPCASKQFTIYKDSNPNFTLNFVHFGNYIFHCLQCSSFENITISSVLKTLREHCAECRDFFRYFIYFFTNRLDLQSGAEMKKKKKIEDTTKIDMTLAKKVHKEQYPEKKSKIKEGSSVTETFAILVS